MAKMFSPFRRFLVKVIDATRELVDDPPRPPVSDPGISALFAEMTRLAEREAPSHPMPPMSALREILPVNSEGVLCSHCHKEASTAPGSGSARVPVKVKPGQRMLIIARPQRVAFKPDQIIIENGDRWTVHDIRIGNRSQFSQSGDIPGSVFAPGASPAISFETAQTAMDVAFDVTYQGPEQDGEQFRASVVGIAAN